VPDDLRDFRTDDLDSFKIDSDGEFYWRGKRIRAGGWTTANRLSLAALLVALIAPSLYVLANFATIWTVLEGLWSRVAN
jgi:hypothetical protein